MRTTRTPSDDDAMARRLAALRAELDAVRRQQTAAPSPTARAAPDTVPWEAPPTHTRIRPPDPDPDADPAGPVPVPMPGRHARPSVGGVVLGSLPTSLRGRLALGPGQVLVLALLVIGALGGTCWWLVRGTPEVQVPQVASTPVAQASASAAPTLAVAAVSTPGGSSASTASAEVPGEVVVDVAGKVRRPGITVLPAGSRVADALQKAGGARPGVDLTALNLARVLVDGEQILVGVEPPPGAAAAVLGTSTAVPGTGGLVSLNAADQTMLESLPEVGPVTAQAILAWREENGGFTSIDELLEVDGIGAATLEKIAPHVTL